MGNFSPSISMLFRALNRAIGIERAEIAGIDIALVHLHIFCAYSAVSNLLNLGRHVVRAQHYRDLSISAFNE